MNKLLSEASPAMRAAIVALLPQSWRPTNLTATDQRSPVMLALAARLIREATR
ncbi:MAG: hypothetical protein JNM69_23035 [Archangium sp.]|nr:hypothetical protein [Archangium sp.]